MKKLVSLFTLLLLLSCDILDTEPDKPEYIVCPIEHSVVFALTVDYTTNNFLGGHYVSLKERTNSFRMDCIYNAPGDFGDITWYEKSTNTKLFSGTTIWMGKGKQTFPEKTFGPSSFRKINSITKIPDDVIYLPHDEFDISDGVDYESIWAAVENLECTSWVDEKVPAYFYLYRPSVGAGNPEDWYWIIFLKC